MSVNAVEFFWVSLNLATAVTTVLVLADAVRDQRATRNLNGSARGIVARGNVRREWLRLVIQFAFLAVVIPDLFRDGDTPLTWPVAIFLSIPVLLLVNSYSDYRDRGVLARKLAVDIETERNASLVRLEIRTDKLEVLAQDTKDLSTDTNVRVIDIQEKTP